MQTDESAVTNVLAVVSGKPLTEVPADLFIPPDALEVLLDSFTGPLDLLLYLIRRQNLDILDIPIALITHQYMAYINLMEEKRLELAADYLVMAAMLAEIKSQLLLPPIKTEEEQEEDPRLVLVRKLQLYEQFKQAAAGLDELPRYDRDYFPVRVAAQSLEVIIHYPTVSLSSLTEAMANLIISQGHHIHHQINREPLSVRERMISVLEQLKSKKNLSFVQLLIQGEGRMGVVVTFLALLELARQSLLHINQTATFAPIYLQSPPYG